MICHGCILEKSFDFINRREIRYYYYLLYIYYISNIIINIRALSLSTTHPTHVATLLCPARRARLQRKASSAGAIRKLTHGKKTLCWRKLEVQWHERICERVGADVKRWRGEASEH